MHAIFTKVDLNIKTTDGFHILNYHFLEYVDGITCYQVTADETSIHLNMLVNWSSLLEHGMLLITNTIKLNTFSKEHS